MSSYKYCGTYHCLGLLYTESMQRFYQVQIKTHSSVLRSHRITPWVYWQENKECNFPTYVIRDLWSEFNQICCWDAPEVGKSTYQNLKQIAPANPKIWATKILKSFLRFFLSFRTLPIFSSKHILLMWYT